MELLEGETLASRLRRGPLPEREALRIGAEIAEALGAAHAQGIVHRDVKPANVMLTRSGAKRLDFGLARLQRRPDSSGEVASATTGSGVLAGTVPYMPPEQLDGKEADARADIWALGCVLFETLAGRRAFEGDSQARLIAAIEKEDLPSLRILRPAASLALDRLVRDCLKKDARERWQSAQDVALRLREILEGGGESEGDRPTRETKRLSGAAVATRGGLLLVVAAAIAAAFAAGRLERRPAPSYRQLTFRRGIVDRARFAPDGRTVVYSARWEGRASEVFTARLDLAEAQALSLARSARLDAQRGGEALIHYDDGRWRGCLWWAERRAMSRRTSLNPTGAQRVTWPSSVSSSVRRPASRSNTRMETSRSSRRPSDPCGNRASPPEGTALMREARCRMCGHLASSSFFVSSSD